MSSSISNIAIAGAAGALGDVVFRRLLESDKFQVRVLRNQGSKSTYPPGTDVVDVDYTSVESLTTALAGQEALVSTVGAAGLAGQRVLVDAAIAAGVNRFIPSEFGADMDNPNTQKLSLFVPKVQVHEYLIEKSKTTNITYTFIYTGSFMDWGFENNLSLNLLSNKPEIVEGGDVRFSGILLSTAGDAVVGVLDHLNETKNRAVFVEDFVTTQNHLLELAKRAAPGRDWAPVHVRLEDLEAVANARLSQGLYDMETFRPFIFRAIVDPTYGGPFAKVDNELLGIKRKTEDDLLKSMEQVLARHTL